MGRLSEAEVSPDAGLRSLASLLPAGRAFVLLDGAGAGAASVYRSPGTDNPGIRRGQALDRPRLERVFDRSGTARHQGRQVWWGAYEARMDVPSGGDDWRGALLAIVHDVAPGQDQGGPLWRSANGVAAAAHGDARAGDAGQLAVKIRQRFHRRDDLQHVVEHCRFEEFVLARARAFIANR